MRDIGGHGSGRRPPAPDSRRHGLHGVPGTNGANGHAHHPGPGRPYDTLAAEMFDDEGPIDLVELQADDELISALSSGLGVSGPGQHGYDTDDRLVAMLACWRADVDVEPFPQLVEPDVASEMLAPARRSRRVSYLRPVIAAVAVAACGLGVLSVTAHEAVPGDSLWGLSKVLYSDRAEQVQAAADLRSGIDRVNAKLASGDTAGARQDLAALGPLLALVEPGQERAYFDQQSQFLTAKVAETPPGTPTDPAAPLRDGTQPPLPPSSEGQLDPVPAPAPAPAPAPGAGTSPQAPTVPGPSSGGSGSSDPRGLQAPQGTPPDSGPTAPAPAEPTDAPDPPPPTTEGSVDPTETTTTLPTASGPEGDEPGSTSDGTSSTTS